MLKLKLKDEKEQARRMGMPGKKAQQMWISEQEEYVIFEELREGQ